jgi:predicted DNA-binding transcriptional regulator YafY
VRGYRADRFSQAAVSDRPFRRPEGFDLVPFWEEWRDRFERGLPVVMVSVRARAGCAGRLRRVVEPARAGRVDCAARPDGAGWVRLSLPFEKLEYARAALLGFGADVEVLGPAELRSQMVAAAVGLGTLYSTAG